MPEAGPSNSEIREQLQASSAIDAVYVAQAGDTLSNIAKKATGDYREYRSLNEHNNRDPEDSSLEIGQSLFLPPDWDAAKLGVAAP